MSLPVLFTPAESGRQQVSDHWYLTRRRDPVAIELYRRHYSCDRPKAAHYTSGFTGPGESITLVNADGSALFVWKAERFRLDDQAGVECSVFRLENGGGGMRASDLIREAMSIAWERWTGERLFTFVKPSAVQSTNPGWCFICAGWTPCGWSKGGLRILEVRS